MAQQELSGDYNLGVTARPPNQYQLDDLRLTVLRLDGKAGFVLPLVDQWSQAVSFKTILASLDGGSRHEIVFLGEELRRLRADIRLD